MSGDEDVMVFQDQMLGDDNAADVSPAEVFFDIANEKVIAYRLFDSRTIVRVHQDSNVPDSTGGVVWETSYFLATYFERSGDMPKSGTNVLEVGAGCGLLGLVIAHHGCHVVSTESAETIAVLRANVDANQNTVIRSGGSIAAEILHWQIDGDRALIGQRKFDVVVGTDVVFDKALVEPLLATMHHFCHSSTSVWLCVQERCALAHAELLRLAPKYFAEVQNLSKALSTTPGCASAGRLECWLLRLSGRREVIDPNEEVTKVHSDPASTERESRVQNKRITMKPCQSQKKAKGESL